MSWTPERVELLRKYWDEGMSASQIARTIGGMTRNAVIGKIHRLGIAGRAQPHRERQSQQRNRTVRPFVELPQAEAAAPIIELPPVTLEDGQHVTIANVTGKQCRWPYGDPQHADFHLCGNATLAGSVYCHAHTRKAYNNAPTRHRKDEATEELAVIARAERIFG